MFYHHNTIDPYLINKHAEINYHINYRLIIREGVRTFIEPERIINNHYNNYQEAACIAEHFRYVLHRTHNQNQYKTLAIMLIDKVI